jgi:uncharacterized repeat protein (TIGR02543 family)
LQNYFISKGLTGAMLTQIVNEISGASPFFYLSSDGTGNYSLVDGFQKALGAGDKPLVIDNDYPTGTYVYNGTLTGTNSAILPVTVTLVVAMQIPTPPSPTTYTVTFDANGGIPTPSAITGITSGATVTLPTAPTLAGNTFNGWFTAATGGTSFNGTTPVTANITVYAQWTPVVVILPTITIYTFNGVAGSVTVTPTTSNSVLINLTASENVNWMSIYVENISDSSIRREFTSGAGCVDGTSSCSKSWDGKDKSSGGNVLPNGDYHIKVHIKDAVNNEFNDYLTSQIITVSNP